MYQRKSAKLKITMIHGIASGSSCDLQPSQKKRSEISRPKSLAPRGGGGGGRNGSRSLGGFRLGKPKRFVIRTSLLHATTKDLGVLRLWLHAKDPYEFTASVSESKGRARNWNASC